MEREETKEKHEIFPVVIMSCLFILVYALGLLVITPFESAGIEPAFEDPDDPLNIVYIFVVMIIFTILILLIAKFWKKKLIQVIILGAIGYTSFYAFFMPLFVIILPILQLQFILLLSIVATAVLIYGLYKYPEWYIIDICGIIVGTSAIVIFGISLGILLVIILLSGLAIYDAISVYKTKHMIDLADAVMGLKLPVLLVVPKIKSYSLIKETKSLKEKLKENKERDAFFMGLGDIVMPGILVIATYYYTVRITQGLSVFFLPFSVVVGTLLGFFILMTFVRKGKPQAGLPFLCGGAIVGYFVSSYLQFGALVGISFQF